MTDDTLAQAIAAIKAGQRDVGSQQLKAVLRADPNNETAWLWMSGIVDSPQQKRDCLQRVLSLNPNNEMARKGLEQLAQSEAASFLSAFAPNAPTTSAPATPAPMPPAQEQAPIAPPAMPFASPAPVAPPAFAMPLPNAPAPIAIQPEPADTMFEPVPIDLDGTFVPSTPQPRPAPTPAPPSAPLELPPVAKIEEAPCGFCGAPTGINAVCANCGTEQVIDCPSCGRADDVRENWTCECGENLRLYLNKQGQLDRERLGDVYAMRDYPAAAVKQWKAAVETHPKPQQLHRKIAEMYLKVGLIEQARIHNDLAKKK